MYKHLLLFTIILFISVTASAEEKKGNRKNYLYKNTKERMRVFIHDTEAMRFSFFCGCSFDDEMRLNVCEQYDPMRYGYHAKWVGWAHVVPVRSFGKKFKAWTRGHRKCYDRKGDNFRGRRCARKRSRRFRRMECDMYNIVPIISELNHLRESRHFGEIPGKIPEELLKFGKCDFIIDAEREIVAPAASIRGDIARIYIYMNWAYPKKCLLEEDIAEAPDRIIPNRAIFDKWAAEDPVDARECNRCKKIEAFQGNENPIVKEACIAAGLWQKSDTDDPQPDRLPD